MCLKCKILTHSWRISYMYTMHFDDPLLPSLTPLSLCLSVSLLARLLMQYLTSLDLCCSACAAQNSRAVQKSSEDPKKELSLWDTQSDSCRQMQKGLTWPQGLILFCFTGIICYIRLEQAGGHRGQQPPSLSPLPAVSSVSSSTASFNPMTPDTSFP